MAGVVRHRGNRRKQSCFVLKRAVAAWEAGGVGNQGRWVSVALVSGRDVKDSNIC